MRHLVMAAVAVGVLCGAAVGQHTDIHLLVSGDGTRFETGTFDYDAGGVLEPGVRVFERDFGESGQPRFTDDPGINATSGTLPLEMLVGFDLVDAVRVWDGVDFETVSGTITVSRFSSSAVSPPTAGGFTPGFWLDSTGQTGGVHVHPNYFVNAPTPAGIYLLTMGLRTDHPTIEDPAPVYVVFNYADPNAETEVPAAVAYVESLLAPPLCVGDLDGDDDTDVLDFNIFAPAFGSVGLDPFTGGDLDGDGDVDVFDFNIFAPDFGCGVE